ncbi:MAG: J domain-containing protein [Chthonomonadales bacterium]
MDTDPYTVLGVPRDATPLQIKEAWARKVREHPPDRDPIANQRINEAKRLLLDGDIRARVDALLDHGEGMPVTEPHEPATAISRSLGPSAAPSPAAAADPVPALNPASGGASANSVENTGNGPTSIQRTVPAGSQSEPANAQVTAAPDAAAIIGCIVGALIMMFFVIPLLTAVGPIGWAVLLFVGWMAAKSADKQSK